MFPQTKTEQIDQIRTLAKWIVDRQGDPINIAAGILDLCGNGGGCISGQPIIIDYTHTGFDGESKANERTQFLSRPLDLWWGDSKYHFGYQWYMRVRDELKHRNHEFGTKVTNDIRDIALLDIHTLSKDQE
jgi:hypothetical protein